MLSYCTYLVSYYLSGLHGIMGIFHVLEQMIEPVMSPVKRGPNSDSTLYNSTRKKNIILTHYCPCLIQEVSGSLNTC